MYPFETKRIWESNTIRTLVGTFVAYEVSKHGLPTVVNDPTVISAITDAVIFVGMSVAGYFRVVANKMLD